MVRTDDGVDLWWEAAGAGPAVVLVPGRGDATDLYPRRFVEQLVAEGCTVVRYDPRDTGLSGAGGSTYSLTDMADDVVTVAAAAGVGPVHLVGVSMGGVILVDLCTRHPELMRSATFVSAMSPDPEAGMGEDFFAAIGADPLAATVRAMGVTDEDDRAWAGAEQAHAARRAPPRPGAAERHQEAAFRLGWPELARLAEIEVPALVVHGEIDRVLPVAHAEALAAGIAGSRMVVREGMGHLPRPADWDEIAALTCALVRPAR